MEMAFPEDFQQYIHNYEGFAYSKLGFNISIYEEQESRGSGGNEKLSGRLTYYHSHGKLYFLWGTQGHLSTATKSLHPRPHHTHCSQRPWQTRSPVLRHKA
jgi:hypothetical protein